MSPAKKSSTAGAGSPWTRLGEASRSGNVAPVYLLVGESPDTRRAAEALTDGLVPPERRSFNLEVYDGRTVAMTRVLDSLRTPAFFPGTKVIWVKDSPVFLSAAKKGEVAQSMLTAWTGGRAREAAEKLATLAALAGWSSKQLMEMDWSAAKKTTWRDVFGDEVGLEHLAQVQAIHEALSRLGIDLAEFRDDGSILLEFFDREFPPDAVLLFSAPAVDARKRLVKRIQEVGQVIEFAVERERSGALSRDSVAAIARERTGAWGKILDGKALENVVERAGQDAASLANELDKLCLYVGSKTRIDEADVRAVVLDRAESWIFDFTSALAARDVGRALPMLRDLLSQGEPPLRILALVAREVRLLLVARECVDELGAAVWRVGMPYGAFQSRVLPAIDGRTKEAFGKAHPYALFRRFEDASKFPAPVLRRALVELGGLDSRFKSSGGDQGRSLESFVVSLCR